MLRFSSLLENVWYIVRIFSHSIDYSLLISLLVRPT